MDNLIMESDSQIVINSILGKIMASSSISYLVSDNITLAQLRHIHFNYCNRAANKVADMLAKKAHFTINGFILLLIMISFFALSKQKKERIFSPTSFSLFVFFLIMNMLLPQSKILLLLIFSGSTIDLSSNWILVGYSDLNLVLILSPDFDFDLTCYDLCA